MKTIEAFGLIWPKYNTSGRENTPKELQKNFSDHVNDLDVPMKYVKKRDVVVQAGGNCGMWPRWLAKKFNSVYTFEPDPAYFYCLSVNVRNSPNVFPFRALLGNDRGPLSMDNTLKWTGSEHATHNAGNVPVLRIDDLGLRDCDAIILDVEGMELPALMGAEKTIARFAPVVVVEDRGHGDTYGWGSYADVVRYLQKIGGMDSYREIERIAKDVVLCAL